MGATETRTGKKNRSCLCKPSGPRCTKGRLVNSSGDKICGSGLQNGRLSRLSGPAQRTVHHKRNLDIQSLAPRLVMFEMENFKRDSQNEEVIAKSMSSNPERGDKSLFPTTIVMLVLGFQSMSLNPKRLFGRDSQDCLFQDHIHQLFGNDYDLYNVMAGRG